MNRSVDTTMFLLSISVCVGHRIQMTGDENDVGRGGGRFLAYWLVVVACFVLFFVVVVFQFWP